LRGVIRSFYLSFFNIFCLRSASERAISERRAQIFKELWRLYKEKDVRGRAIRELLKEALELKMDVVFAEVSPEGEPWLKIDVSKFVSQLKREFNSV